MQVFQNDVTGNTQMDPLISAKSHRLNPMRLIHCFRCQERQIMILGQRHLLNSNDHNLAAPTIFEKAWHVSDSGVVHFRISSPVASLCPQNGSWCGSLSLGWTFQTRHQLGRSRLRPAVVIRRRRSGKIHRRAARGDTARPIDYPRGHAHTSRALQTAPGTKTRDCEAAPPRGTFAKTALQATWD